MSASPAAGLRERLAATPRSALAATLPFLLWGGYVLAVRGERRWEVVALIALVPALATLSEASRRLLWGLYPIGLVGLLYDGNRLVERVGVTASRVHVCDLRAWEAALFGWGHGADRWTLHDWFQAHHAPSLDVLAAVPYGTHIFAALAFGLFLYRRSPEALARFGWAFLALNAAGLLTHHAWPAAAPWYYHAHGCAVDLATPANPGPNLLRVDALLGVDYFRSLYGRSHDVFGAMPSLHVAYPALIVLEGRALLPRALRALSVVYLALMAFAAVYLDHHWVLDVLAGLAFALAAWAAVGALSRARGRTPAAPRPSVALETTPS